MLRWEIGSGHLFIRQDDITTLAVDAIVNAANSELAGGGGVDGSIHHAAGRDLLHAACQVIIESIGSLPVGEALLTPGFNLPARYIIHTVGPFWRGGTAHESHLLRNAYLNSLRLAHHHSITTIAFPAISCGVFGYPHEDAARCALATLEEGLAAGLVSEAGMVLHGADTYNIWAAVAKDLF
ncbi:macro domain-containing protein [Pseudodesulfovibrio piezophilus]|uniref:Macro domain-containing protein n=1 Tax=Pseudodesulfovibrio piezophilus (strain DSM 21447 / JCM 15486 / C1TLV30) TaxID=1322246 RepID=M1WPF2_PSEP2|nr:macro domain-containing protein [Pseudodesulfovibrio piezophilus]CCH48324.1 conserved protein of unknown function [Pseudodesulfovibrio piezophilus C1TLV30]